MSPLNHNAPAQSASVARAVFKEDGPIGWDAKGAKPVVLTECCGLLSRKGSPFSRKAVGGRPLPLVSPAWYAPAEYREVLLGVRSGGEALAQHRRPAAGRDCDLRLPRGRRVEGRLRLGDGGRGDRRRRRGGIELFNRKSRRRCGIHVLRFSNIKSSGSLKRELTA